MKGTMIKQKGFAWRLRDRLERRLGSQKEVHERVLNKQLAQRITDRKESHSRILALTADDLDFILSEVWEELSDLLHEGKRVIFEGWASFFTRPIKRKCYNIATATNWWTWRRRVRMTPLPNLRKQAERDISVEEYDQYTANRKKKDA